MSRVLQMARSAAGSLLAGLAVFGAALWLGYVPRSQLTVRADLEVGGGTFVAVFLNNSPDALRTPVIPRRRVYQFSRRVSTLEALRLDPVDADNVEIRLYSIEVVGPGGDVLARFGPEAVGEWTARGMDVVERAPDVITLRSTDSDPALIGHLPAGGLRPTVGGRRAALVARLRADLWLPYVLVLPLLALVQIRPIGSWLLRTLLAAGVIVVWPRIYQAVIDIDWGPAASMVAISRAAYEGISLPSIQMAVAVGFAATCVLGLVIGLWRPARPTAAADDPPPVRARCLVLAGLVIVILTAPDLPWTLAWLKSAQYNPHWDYNNMLYWAYWTAHDRLPLRDFWYPYGGLFLYDLPWPTGPLIGWTTSVGRYAVFAFALMLASPRRPWSVLLATAALLAAETSGLNFAVHRYLLAANVVLAYVAARRRQFRGWLPLLTLALALVLPLALEPAQLVYAVPGVAAIALLDLVSDRRAAWWWQGPVFCAAVLLAASLVLAAVLWRHGMLAETWVFYQRLGDTSQYAAFPATVVPDPWPEFPLGSVVVWFPALVMIVGLAELRRDDPQARVRATALVGLAVVDFMVLQKHLIRPMPDTLVLNAFIAGLTFGVLSPAGRWGPDRVGLGAGLGLLAAGLMLQGRLEERLSIGARLPARLIGTLGVLATPEALAEGNRERFAAERLALFESQRNLVDQLTRRHGRPVQLFALTDEPVLYLLTGQPPSWHSNLYNGSPVYEQQRIIASLVANPPDYVVAMQSRLMFDGIPIGVRVPDVVAFVIAHFVPDTPVDPYTVLRPRRPGDAVPLAFWRDFFGESLDLGMLPALLADRHRAACGPGDSCEESLVLESSGPVSEEAVSVRLDVGGVPVSLRVRLKAPRSRYVIPLSRLWPSAAARAAGVTLVPTPPEGFTLERVPAARPARQLY